MHSRWFMKGMMGLLISLITVMSYAASIEGYWISIDDRSGEKLSIIEIKKASDNTYRGKTVYLFPNAAGGAIEQNCVKCPPPYTNKPRLGLEFLTGMVDDPKHPNQYINGTLLEPRSGKIYKGKARLSADGKRLHLRGYMGVSLLGRSVVWLRTDGAKP